MVSTISKYTKTMKLNNLLLIVLLAIAVSACKNNKESEENTATEQEMTTTSTTDKKVSVVMNSKSGSNVEGTISFKSLGVDGVMMTVALTGLEPGTHAIHLHQNGDCSADDASSAGPHWNPTESMHGKWGDENHHLGDIANLEADENGTANLTFTTERWSLNEGDENSILGKAVVVHAKADDFTSQPSGAAGSRIACGVIQ